MNRADISALKRAMITAADDIVAAEPELTRIDMVIGDGDHGIGMRTGFSALSQVLSSQTFEKPYDLLRESGMTLIKVMGGTSGVIFGTLFIGGLHGLTDKTELTVRDLADYFEGGREAIARRGKVDRGDKTMYDALADACDALRAAADEGLSVEEAFGRTAGAAKSGAEKTKDMLSRKGRSKNFRDKTLGHPDSGAVSTSIIFEALAEAFTEASAD